MGGGDGLMGTKQVWWVVLMVKVEWEPLGRGVDGSEGEFDQWSRILLGG